jgi:hypothetical protein
VDSGSVIAIARSLQKEGVRYLVVGGLAVVHHGYLRFTADVDIVLDMDPDNVRRAIRAFTALGYKPRAPVPFEQYADPMTRAVWAREKNMKVFALWSPEHVATVVDLFLESPFDFARAYAAGGQRELAPGVVATFVGLDDLLKLKAESARPVDLDDINHLRQGQHDDER